MKKTGVMRWMSCLVCFALLLSAIPVAIAAPAGTAFKDVEASAYYYDAVAWAVEQGITNGTSATQFSPNSPCTRGQIVTFLWRTAGSPKVPAGAMPFKDVKADAYYYDAVRWAVKQGITTGTSATQFSPDSPCTRGQIVTFLWRFAGSPAPSSDMPFKDVQASAYYCNAVKWAVQNKITSGVSATQFSPDSPCTRGQIVTFLYRYVAAQLKISAQPADYQMVSSQENATFTVAVSGGVAPYTYQWHILYDNTEVKPTAVTTEETSNTLTYSFSDYDFDEYRGILVYCVVTDANGKSLESANAEVLQYTSLALKSSPADYQMTSSEEDATFTVAVSGGVAPYTYQWFILYDNVEVKPTAATTEKTSNTLTHSFSDYDFDEYRGILVNCVVTDAAGKSVESAFAEVLQKP